MVTSNEELALEMLAKAYLTFTLLLATAFGIDREYDLTGTAPENLSPTQILPLP